MNTAKYHGFLARFHHRLMLSTRYLNGKPTCASFGTNDEGLLDTIQRIYVINLDRQVQRWRQVRRELQSIDDRFGKPLTAMTRRFSAVDARYYTGTPSRDELQPYYSLAEQLFVEPHPLLAGDIDKIDQRIDMTRQEVAVALSHVEVWKVVAGSNVPYTLVLEDDVYFRHGFARTLDQTWAELVGRYGRDAAFDLLYLSYKEASTGAHRTPVSKWAFRPRRGIWQMSGYVLSNQGAKRLLELLPLHGPVDLWINHHFEQLNVVATQQSIIEQRLNCPSTNSYSILPVLSKVGVLTLERPMLFKTRKLPGPVFAFGEQGSGLTALGMALSMLGYRCCSDITQLPVLERDKLFANKKTRIFDAYVNVGAFKPYDYLELAKTYRHAKFIITKDGQDTRAGQQGNSSNGVVDLMHVSGVEENNRGQHSGMVEHLKQFSGNVLVFSTHTHDKWELLCSFLGSDYPTDQYPECEDLSQRNLALGRAARSFYAKRLSSDSSPWIAPQKNWCGISISEDRRDSTYSLSRNRVSEHFNGLDRTQWTLRDDTFPSNLALFRPGNFTISSDSIARLALRKERTSVREYTSAAICSNQHYLYGRFVAEVKPANVSGLVTGVFLYRSSPRQEIDIEFLGKDTTKLLINVYYNPGADGARMEYGYRGTPVLIDLGFDASQDFHRYEIEWTPRSIRWYVDEKLAYERVNWDPTPIPHLSMQLNVNLWHSRSEELAGRLSVSELPAQTGLRAIEIFA